MSTTWLRNTPDGLLTGLDDTGTHVPLETASYRRLVTPDGKVWILAGGEPETKGYPEFDPNQPRDDHGRWGGGGGTATAESALGGESKLSGLTKLLADPDSGFTVSMRTGLSPEHGYVVSIYPDRSKAVAKGDVTLAALAEYVKANRDLLVQPGRHFGAWHDPKDGTVYLDVSVVVPTADEAETLARDHDQIAYFDLQTMKSVDVNHAATSGGQKPVPAGAASGKLARVRSAHGQAEDQGDLAADADAGGLGGVGHGTHGPVTHRGRDRRGAEAPGGRHGPVLKYSDDQPRVPAGHPDGGQWTDGGGGGGGSADSPPSGTPPAYAPLSDVEINAIKFYTGPDYYGLNSNLWHGRPLTPEQQQVATVLDGLTGRDLAEPVDVWRGMRVSQEWVDQNLKPGAILDHKGFVSTSTDVGQAAWMLSRTAEAHPERNATQKVPLYLRILGVTRGLFPGKHTEYPEQKELVLKRGSRLRINRILPPQTFEGEQRGRKRSFTAMVVEASVA